MGMASVLKMINAAARAELHGKPVAIKREYTPEQQQKLDMYERVARIYCLKHGKDPDESVDTVGSVNALGDPQIFTQARWTTTVDFLHDINLCFVEAFDQAEAAATSAQESEAVAAQSEVAH